MKCATENHSSPRSRIPQKGISARIQIRSSIYLFVNTRNRRYENGDPNIAHPCGSEIHLRGQSLSVRNQAKALENPRAMYLAPGKNMRTRRAGEDAAWALRMSAELYRPIRRSVPPNRPADPSRRSVLPIRLRARPPAPRPVLPCESSARSGRGERTRRFRSVGDINSKTIVNVETHAIEVCADSKRK